MIKIKSKVKLSKLERYGFVETADNTYLKTITDTGDRLECLFVDKTTREITRKQTILFGKTKQLKLTTDMLCIRDLVDLDLIEEPNNKMEFDNTILADINSKLERQNVILTEENNNLKRNIEQLKDIEKKCDAYMNMCIAKDDEIETLKCQIKELEAEFAAWKMDGNMMILEKQQEITKLLNQLHELPKKICDEIKKIADYDEDYGHDGMTLMYAVYRIEKADLNEIQAKYEKELQ